MKKSKNSIIIGGGLLGLELTTSLRIFGQQVEVIEIFPRLLPKQLDQDGAAILKEQVETKGMGIKLNVKTENFLGEKTVSGILLGNGEEISGEHVVISAGVRSNIDLALKAGIKVNNGIIVGAIILEDTNGVKYLKRIIQNKTDVTTYTDLLLDDDFDKSQLII